MKYVQITKVCDFQGGTQPPKDEWIKEPKEGYIRMLQIRDFTQPDKNNIEYIVDKRNLKKCNVDDILIGRYGASIGKICTGLEGAYNVALSKVCPKDSNLDRRYLLYILKSNKFYSFINNVGSRAAQAGFNKSDLNKFKIPLPTLAEQQRIANILDAADALRKKTQQIIDRYDELAQSVFLDMFGDPVKNEKGWEIVGIETACSDIFLGLTNKVDYVEEGGFPLIRTTDIKGGKLSFENVRYISEAQHRKITKNRISKRGDILVSKSGTLGTTAIVDTDIEFTTYESIITIQSHPDKLVNHYLNFLLKNTNFQIKMLGGKTGGTVGHLNLLMFREITFPLPSLKLQNQFAEKIELIEKQKELAKQSLKESEDLFNALLQKAFKGN